ncbi:MAG: NFACT family protein [Thermosulfidibacteraceae bacterium]|jgi:predicted ribosome quality control (RQC) complex YloA/Tae2 family protein
MDYYTLRKLVLRIAERIKGERILDIKGNNRLVELKLKTASLLFSFDPEKAGLFLTERRLVEGEDHFSRSLKRFIKGLRIRDISVVEGDRLVRLSFLRVDPLGRQKSLVLVYEILGRFLNLILIEEGIIKLARRGMETENRVVVPGRKYFEPKRVFSNSFNLPFVNNAIAEEINKRGLEAIKEELFSSNFWVYDGKIYPYNVGGMAKRFEGDVLEHFLKDFLKYMEDRELRDRKAGIISLLKGRMKKLKSDVEKISKNMPKEEEVERYHLFGTALLTYANNVVEYTNGKYKLPNPYTGEIIEIPIVDDMDPVRLANYYFTKHSTSKRSLEAARKRLEEKREELGYLEDLIWQVENVSSIQDIYPIEEILGDLGLIKCSRVKREVTPCSLYYTFDFGRYKVFVGKNSKGNDYVTFRLAVGEDLWFHVKDYPGAHVVMKCFDKVEESDIERVAGIALYFSKLRDTLKGDVDYTFVKNVKRLGRILGRVLYTDYKTLRVKVYNPFEGGDHD